MSAANLWSEWPHQTLPEYPALLREAGYFVGHYRKAWGPGKCVEQPAGKRLLFISMPAGKFSQQSDFDRHMHALLDAVHLQRWH